MPTERTLRLRRPRVDPQRLGFLRFGRVAGKVMITGDAGDWHLLAEKDFEALLGGRIEPGHPEHQALSAKGFLREGSDFDALAARLERKKDFVGQGPHLHIVLTTLRCNQDCRYCHASRTSMDRVETDMSVETARHVVDLILETTSPYVNIEFQGGEPTVNFDTLKFIVEESRRKNASIGKILDHSLVTNMTWMDEEKAEWLIDNEVLVCTSLDGPEALHNWNRAWAGGGSAYASVLKWIHWFNRRYVERGRDPRLWHVDALMTTTRKTFDSGRELIDLYVDLGIRNIHLRPLNPYGFAVQAWRKIGYTTEEFLDFYTRCLDHIIELNRQGVEIMEGTAAIFLVKLLTPDDPNFVDIRSPAGAGTGALAYNYDGRIYPGDEARMIAAMGNDIFCLGRAGETTYEQVVGHPTVRAVAVASVQDALPACHTCWNKPFCGIDPVDNYMTSGDLFGQRPLSANCKIHYRIVELLLERLASDGTGEIGRIFRRWTVRRPRFEPPPAE